MSYAATESSIPHVRSVLAIGPPELCIAPEGNAPAREAALSDTLSCLRDLHSRGPARMDACGDVYRGLARLSRRGSIYETVVVCVDGLTETELRFFEEARRVRRDINIFVAGSARRDGLLAQAEARGAHLLDQPAVEDILSRTMPARSLATRRYTNLSVDCANADCTQPTTAGATKATSKRPDNGYEVDGAESSEPVRVPWLRYGDRPVRQAPGVPPARADTVAPSRPPFAQPPGAGMPTDADAPQSSGRAIRDEPLLTEEELRALLTDDISTIVPGAGLGYPTDRFDDEDANP